jgi:hypothetical protein
MPITTTYPVMPSYRIPFHVGGGGGGGIGTDPATLSSARLILDSDEEYLSVRTAAQFTAANSEFLSVDNTAFDKENTDFSLGGWFYSDSDNRGYITKWAASSQKSYILYRSAAGVLQFGISDSGSGTTNVVGTTLAVNDTWQFIACVHDSVNDVIKISVNGAAFEEVAHTTGAYNSTADFIIGDYDNAHKLNGRVDSPYFYDKALSQAEVTTLYNAGAGQNYYDIDKVGLVSFWSLNETSGTRYDMHGGNHLTDNNTVTYADGKVLDRGQDVIGAGNAAQFTAANSEHLTNASADFRFGDTDFSYATWLYLDAAASYPKILDIGAPSGNYGIYLDTDNATRKPRIVISNNGVSSNGFTHSTALSLSTWHFVVFTHDSVANTINISMDGAAFESKAHSGGMYNTNGSLVIGAWYGGGAAGSFWNGRMDNSAFYNKALTIAQVQALYGGGLGQNYDAVDKVSLMAYWDFNEESGTRLDSHTGGYDLTDNNTVTFDTGKVYDQHQTLYDISYWNDRSGQGNHFEQATPASRPSYNSVTGKITMVAASTEFLACINGSTPFGSDSQGELIIVASDNKVVSLGNASLNQSYHLFRHAAGNHEIVSNLGGTVTQAQYDANDSISDILVSNHSSNGSRFRNNINNVDLPITVASGANDGKWFDQQASNDEFRIGRYANLSGPYANMDIKALYYFNAELSTADRDAVMAWINNKYSVYTPITAYADLGANLKFNFKVDPSPLTDAPNTVAEHAETDYIARNHYTAYATEKVSGLLQGADRNTFINEYTSDFTAGVDGWSATKGTVTGNETINGSGGWLKFVPDDLGAANYGISKIGATTTARLYKHTARVFFPSGNPYVGIGILSSTVARVQWDDLGNGEFLITSYVAVTNSIGYLAESAGSNIVPNEPTGLMYIKDITWDRVTSEAFFQYTPAADVPHINASGTAIEFDGIAEYMSDYLGQLFTAISADTQGEWIALFDDDAGAGVASFPIGITQSGVNLWHLIGVSNTNLIRITQGGSNIDFGSLGTRGGVIEISVSSSGTAYSAFLAFVQQAVSAGVDNGNWIGDEANLDIINIGRYVAASTVYYALGLKRLIYINRQLGMDERRQFKKFRDNE